jgi:hypothetical protein
MFTRETIFKISQNLNIWTEMPLWPLKLERINSKRTNIFITIRIRKSCTLMKEFLIGTLRG